MGHTSDYEKAHPEYRKKQDKRRNSNKRKGYKALRDKYKAGGCVVCGYNKCIESLAFHHIKEGKKNTISQAGSIKQFLYELELCICVCANCHGEIHAGLIDALAYEPVVNRHADQVALFG